MSWSALLLRALRLRLGTSSLVAASAGLSVMVAVLVLSLRYEADRRLEHAREAPPLIVGSSTSPTSLVLATVFFSEDRLGLLSPAAFEALRDHPSTRITVPLAMGDSFRGYPLVATTSAFLSPELGLVAEVPLRAGRAFEPEVAEAVIGAGVAAALDLRVGDRIEPAHGSEDGSAAHHGEHLFDVVGVLTETGTAVDRVVVVPLKAFWALPEHVEGHAVSAAYVVPKAGMHHAILTSELRKRPDVVVAETSREIARLERYLGSATTGLAFIGGLVLVIAWLGLAATIWAVTRGRLRELALLRLVGAERWHIFGLVVAEGAIIATAGAVVGYALAAVALWLIHASAVHEWSAWHRTLFSRDVLGAVLLVPLVGALAGLPPAVEVHRRDLAGLLRRSS